MSVTKKLSWLIAVLLVMTSLTACDMPMKIIGTIPEPEETVKAFFDSVCSGNFAESDRYLSGVSLSMKKPIDGDFAQKLYHYLIQSYRYQINGEVTSDQLNASCSVDFTALNMNLLSGDLKKESTRIGKNYVSEKKEGFVQETDGAYELSDEGAVNVAAEALDSLLQSSDNYRSTKTYEIAMKYSGGKWQIILPEELFYAICGGFDLSE